MYQTWSNSKVSPQFHHLCNIWFQLHNFHHISPCTAEFESFRLWHCKAQHELFRSKTLDFVNLSSEFHSWITSSWQPSYLWWDYILIGSLPVAKRRTKRVGLKNSFQTWEDKAYGSWSYLSVWYDELQGSYKVCLVYSKYANIYNIDILIKHIFLMTGCLYFRYSKPKSKTQNW